MQIKKALHGMKPYVPGRTVEEIKAAFGLTDIIKLASNENPLGPSPKAKEAVIALSEELALYPDGGSMQLRKRLAAVHGVSEGMLLFGNGSDEVILILCRAMLSEGTNIVIADPTFPQYAHNAVIEGAGVIRVPLKDGVHDLPAMLTAINDETRIVFVCNPNNPSGTYVPHADICAFVERVPQNVLVVLDEAYFEYVMQEQPASIDLVKRYPNVCVLRTFSKAYGLASLRIGYGVLSEALVRAVEPAREPFNTNRIAQAAALASLDDATFLPYVRETNEAGKQQYVRFADENGLFIYPSEANFVLLDLGLDGNEAFDWLLRQGIIVRSGGALGFPTCVRITIGTNEQNAFVIEKLSALLLEKKVETAVQ
ncbi:MAG: histidinol-phosphate transaminase [Bacilli bacterium]